MRALVIAHEPDGPAAQIESRLLERGFEVDTHVVTDDYDLPNRAAAWPDTSGYDLIIPMGSIRSLTDKDPIDTWIHDELALLRRAHDAGKPLLGVCFGGQLLAEALGGSVETAPITELGWFEIEAGPAQRNPVGPGPWMEWHHDRFTPPPEATVLAVNDNACQLFRLGRTVGTQFHPEVTIEHIEGWLEQVDDEYLATYGTNRSDVLADVTKHAARNREQCNALVDWFLDEIAFPGRRVGVVASDTERSTAVAGTGPR